MIFDWPKVGPPNQINQNNSAEMSGNIRGFTNRGQGGGRGGGNPPPGLGGLRGSDWKVEKFGGSEEKKRDLHADRGGRRINMDCLIQMMSY